MAGTIGPMVHGTRIHNKVAMAMLFASAHLLGGAAVGVTIAAMGRWLLPAVLRTSRGEALVCSIGCLLFSLHEIRIIKLPLPQFRQQVPKRWRRLGARGVFLYGSALGAGIGTRIVSASFYVVLIGVFFSGNVAFGTIAMLTYGLSRGLPIAISALFPLNTVYAFVSPLLTVRVPVNLASAAILAHFGVFLYRLVN
jgi:cytochrome c biogenesis protein CcdA